MDPRDTLPLIGYKRFASDLLESAVRSLNFESFKIPGEVFIESARAVPCVVSEIASAEITNPKLSDWYRASKAAKLTLPERYPIDITESWTLSELKIDPTFALELPNTEICEAIRLVEDSIELLNVNRNSLAKFAELYKDLEAAGVDLGYRGLIRNFSSVRALMASSLPLLQGLAKVSLGEVTFGAPSLFGAPSRKFDLPENFANSHEGYWVDFPVTYGEMNYRGIKTLIFEVMAAQGVISLGLAPARQGIETTINTTLSAPKVSVNALAKLSIEDYYKREVSSSWSRPTIITEGLGENDFCWRMTDEAVERGSKTFSALLAVPKNRDKLTLKAVAAAETKEGITQGSITGTTDKSFTLNLR